MLLSDPINLKLTDDGDLDPAFTFDTGLDAIVAGVHFRLGLIRGEWFLDLDAGVAWFPTVSVPEADALLGRKFNEARARLAIIEAVRGTPGINEVLSVAVAFDSRERNMTISWRANTVFGIVSDTQNLAVSNG